MCLEIGIHCFQCGIELKGNHKCGNCLRRRVGIKCSICHQTVRGMPYLVYIIVNILW